MATPLPRKSHAGGKGAALRYQQGDFSELPPAISLMVTYSVIFVTTGQEQHGNRMKILTAKEAKYSFGQLTHLARAKPVAVAG
jgi:hypothetical protein